MADDGSDHDRMGPRMGERWTGWQASQLPVAMPNLCGAASWINQGIPGKSSDF